MEQGSALAHPLRKPVMCHRVAIQQHATVRHSRDCPRFDVRTGKRHPRRRHARHSWHGAHPVDGDPASLGPVNEWQAEWKWDGIRAQLVRRRGRTFLWSRGEELLASRFPEIEAAAEWLPDGTVLDGDLLAWRDGKPLPFTELQRRINRKTVGRKLLTDVPCHLLVYDCLERDNVDVRTQSLDARRGHAISALTALPGGSPFGISPIVAATSWQQLHDARATSRDAVAEGLMLKRRAAAYGVGRRVGDW